MGIKQKSHGEPPPLRVEPIAAAEGKTVHAFVPGEHPRDHVGRFAHVPGLGGHPGAAYADRIPRKGDVVLLADGREVEIRRVYADGRSVQVSHVNPDGSITRERIPKADVSEITSAAPEDVAPGSRRAPNLSGIQHLPDDVREELAAAVQEMTSLYDVPFAGVTAREEDWHGGGSFANGGALISFNPQIADPEWRADRLNSGYTIGRTMREAFIHEFGHTIDQKYKADQGKRGGRGARTKPAPLHAMFAEVGAQGGVVSGEMNDNYDPSDPDGSLWLYPDGTRADLGERVSMYAADGASGAGGGTGEAVAESFLAGHLGRTNRYTLAVRSAFAPYVRQDGDSAVTHADDGERITEPQGVRPVPGPDPSFMTPAAIRAEAVGLGESLQGMEMDSPGYAPIAARRDLLANELMVRAGYPPIQRQPDPHDEVKVMTVGQPGQHHPRVTYQVKRLRRGGGKFEETRHPRGKDGRFIHIGDHVNLGGGVTGEVTSTGKGGELTVRRSDTGRVAHVDAKKVSTIPRSRTGAVSANHPGDGPAGPLMAPDDGPGPNGPGAPDAGAGGDLGNAIGEVHGGGPMTPEEYQAHTQRIESAIKEAMAAGQTSDKLHTLDGQGHVYTPERAAQHKEILDELWSKADSVPSEGKAVIAGGLGGAGKSTVLGKFANVPQDQYLTINPDDVKEAMAARGMMPEIEGLSPMEASALVHEESSHLANMLAKRAYGARKNVVWDITMSSRNSVQKRVAEMRGAGYQDIQGVFVDIPVETSVQRALSRHQRGMEKHRQGQGAGGRYVPPALIRANNDSEFSSANRRVFEGLRDQFDSWQAWDNSVNGREPVRIAQSANLPLGKPAARGHQTATQKVGNDQLDDLKKLANDLGVSIRTSRGVRNATVTLGGTASQLAEFRRRTSGPSIDWPTVGESPVG
jgi:hypothetical protein